MTARSSLLMQIAAALALAAGALLASVPLAAAPVASSGQILYERHCASCHGKDGKGDGPVAASLRPPPADLTRIRERRGRFDEAEIMAVIDGRRAVAAHGTREMPVWGAVFEEQERSQDAPYPGLSSLMQVRALVDYLRSIQTPPEK